MKIEERISKAKEARVKIEEVRASLRELLRDEPLSSDEIETAYDNLEVVDQKVRVYGEILESQLRRNHECS